MTERYWISTRGETDRINSTAYDQLAKVVKASYVAGEIDDQRVIDMLEQNPLLADAGYRMAMNANGGPDAA